MPDRGSGLCPGLLFILALLLFPPLGAPTLARDAMFAVVMIVMNGMVGLSLRGLRYRKQTCNLQGSNAFLAVIVPVAVLGLVLAGLAFSAA